MKKLCSLGMLMAATLLVTHVYAGFPSINTGNSTMNSLTNKVIDTAKNKVIADEINKDIQKLNCAFQAGKAETTCDLPKVIASIQNKKSVLEAAGLVSNVTVNIVAHGPTYKKHKTLMIDRNDLVYNALSSQLSWVSYNKRTNEDGTNQLELSVSVR